MMSPVPPTPGAPTSGPLPSSVSTPSPAAAGALPATDAKKTYAVGRTLAEFQPLRRAEQRLLDACQKGVQAKIGNSRPRKPQARKVVRAEFVRFLALGGDDTAPLHERGVDLRGAWITGALDMSGCKLPNRFQLVACVIDNKVVLVGAETRTLIFENCRIRGARGENTREAILANLLECTGGLFLHRGFAAKGQVNLIGAHIAGDFVCSGGQFLNPYDIAIFADGIQIDNRVFLRRSRPRKGSNTPRRKTRPKSSKTLPTFAATGTVSFVRAAIKNSADLGNGRFRRPGDIALDFGGADIGAVYLRDAVIAGTAGFISAKIGGDFDCGGSKFRSPGRVAINCDGAAVDGRVFLRRGFDAVGEVRFHSATVGNTFQCFEARFRQAPRASALICIAINVGGVFEFKNIRGYNNRKKISLIALLRERRYQELWDNLRSGQRKELGSDVLAIVRGLREKGFREVWNFIRKGRFKDLLDNLSGRRPTGVVTLLQARAAALSDDLNSWRTTYGVVLDGFHYERLLGPVDAKSRKWWLRHQIHDHLRRDFRPQPWQQLAYVLSEMGHAEDAKQIRIKMRVLGRRSQWLHRQPWILVPYWWIRTRFDKALGLLVGYGYRPWRTPLFLLAVWAVGAWIYTSVETAGVMAPLDGRIARNKSVPPECKIDWVKFSGPRLPTAREIEDSEWSDNDVLEKVAHDAGRRELEARRLGIELSPQATWYQICRRAVPLEYSDFHPGLYSADLMVPFLDLKQRSNWRVRSEKDDTVTLPQKTYVRPLYMAEREVDTAWLLDKLWYWQFGQPILGWALLLLIAGTVSGLIKKD